MSTYNPPLPGAIRQGDTFTCTATNRDYPASDGWGMQLVIRVPIMPEVFAGNPVDDLFSYFIKIDPNRIPTGTFDLVEVFSRWNQEWSRQEQSSFFIGRITIQPDPINADTPSWARTTLVAVEAAITKIASSANAQVSINGQSYTKQNLDQLINLRNYLANQVASEAVADGSAKGNWKVIQTQFGYG